VRIDGGPIFLWTGVSPFTLYNRVTRGTLFFWLKLQQIHHVDELPLLLLSSVPQSMTRTFFLLVASSWKEKVKIIYFWLIGMAKERFRKKINLFCESLNKVLTNRLIKYVMEQKHGLWKQKDEASKYGRGGE